ncbi:MAG: acyltransferase [Deltaproteobacteria bacterium]|nr:acyltransferase [Deltaproteobacteria bacterium]
MSEAASSPSYARAAPPRQARREPLDALTGLRFFAAAHVVLYHFAEPALPAATPAVIRNVLAHGYVGVSFFYLLSGFILAYNYVDRSEDGTVRMRGTSGAFWWNRFARVYPLYLVAWLAAAPVSIGHRLAADGSPVVFAAKTTAAGLVSLGLAQAWLPGAHTWWNPPSWSISVEALFYAAFPALLPRLLAPRRSRLGLALGLYLVALFAPVVYLATTRDELLLALVKYDPLLHLPTFALGILLAELFDSPLRERLLRARVPLGVGAMSVLGLLLATPPGATNLLFHNGLLAPAFGALILAVALGLPMVSPALSSPLLLLLGEASFGLYILQSPVWSGWRRLDLGLSRGVDLAAFFGVLVAVSVAAHRLVELPARRRLRTATMTQG